MDIKDQIRNAANEAWKAHEMAQALDVVHNALPATIPEGTDVMTRQAIAALPCLIEHMIAMTAKVAEQVEGLGDAPKVEAAQERK